MNHVTILFKKNNKQKLVENMRHDHSNVCVYELKQIRNLH